MAFQKIITNENVVEMVRKAVQEEIEEQEMKFEPKLTRSKLKEFEAKGHVSIQKHHKLHQQFCSRL